MYVNLADGRVYSWGTNDHGQCGLGHTLVVNQPELIPSENFLNKKILSVSVGYYHSIVISDDGKAYVFGKHEHFPLQNGNNSSNAVPTLIPALNSYFVKRGICGGFHSLFIVESDDGRMFDNLYKSYLGRLLFSTNGNKSTLHAERTAAPKCVSYFENHNVEVIGCSLYSTYVYCEEYDLPFLKVCI